MVFVNAITDNSSALRLAERFSFQYIPTSVFVAPDGTIVDTYTGPLTESELRTRLDGLIEQ